MKTNFLAILFAFSFSFTIAQRGDVPKENPDNALNLKVVFQEYTVTTTYQHGGSTSSKGEYLNLKVNDMYLPDGNTGISKMHFQRYLTNCPQALDLGLKGLDFYEQSNKKRKTGMYIMLGTFVAGATMVFTQEPNAKSVGTTMGLGFGGLITRMIFNKKAGKLEKKGDQYIVDAFGNYADNCFNSDLYTPPSAYQADPVDSSENGKTNDSESIGIDMISNNAKGRFYSIAALAGFSQLDGIGFNFGPELAFYKKGLYINTKAHYNKSVAIDISQDLKKEFGGSLLASVPILKKVKQPKKTYLSLGDLRGMEAMAVSEDLKIDVFKALSIDLGADYYQQNVDDIGVREYAVKATLLRGGISRSLFTETSFKIDDNRFSESIRYSAMMARFYGHVLYNYKNAYELYPSFFSSGQTPTLETEIGWVLGMDLKYTMKRKSGLGSINLEAGKFPIYNENNRWAVQLKLGYGFYSVDRSQATKSKSRGKSRSKFSSSSTSRR